MSLGILGPSGTFSEAVALNYCPQEKNLVYADSIGQLFLMLNQGKVADILIPFENSSAGILRNSLTGLTEYPVMIKGEIIAAIEQHLMAKAKYELAEIELVVTQPAVLAQCEAYLKANLPGVRVEIAESTTRAAQMVRNESRRAAAIGPWQAAHNYGLMILASGIQQDNNCTRFLHLTNREEEITIGGNKISIIFDLKDRPGALYQALQVFAQRQLNLSKIESYPVKANQGYRFYIEVDIPNRDLAVQGWLTELENHSTAVIYLGNYDRYKEVSRC
jgi:prephenate dehydratase